MIQEAIQYPALIKYLKGFSNYTWVHYGDGRKVLLAKSLVFFEKKLSGFLRVHKTALVNPHYIADFQAPPGHKMAGSVSLRDGERLPVSRRRWSLIIDPLLVKMLPPSLSAHAEPVSSPFVALAGFEKKHPSLASRRMWMVMADELKSGLVQQLMGEKWSQWGLKLFDTGNGLQKVIAGTGEADMPAVIVLDGSQPGSLLTLQTLKNSSRFRFIPTILLSSAGNYDQAQQGYASGANSVIVYPADLPRFIQVLEKIFRYWLSVASAPQSGDARSTPV
ncbi:response regulator transcription factor [Larkinella sp. GY13]|uniref:response regulator transcription factor n=1 Tax=Larkinella sp. GY13 TaxID=3453720 RepID=UPI003EEE86B1